MASDTQEVVKLELGKDQFRFVSACVMYSVSIAGDDDFHALAAKRMMEKAYAQMGKEGWQQLSTMFAGVHHSFIEEMLRG